MPDTRIWSERVRDALSELAEELPEDLIGEDTAYGRLHDIIMEQTT